ncbi:hypothetical protein Tco_0946570 [Tanacetum coccineum]
MLGYHGDLLVPSFETAGLRPETDHLSPTRSSILWPASPTHKFKLKKNGNNDTKDNDSGVDEGGILAPGTEKERAISGEDAVSFQLLQLHLQKTPINNNHETFEVH